MILSLNYHAKLPYIAITLITALTTAAATTVPGATSLQPCPDSPNCVSSLSEDGHRIEPFTVKGDESEAFARLRQILIQRADATVISADGASIRVEFRTTLGFVDDAIFVLDKDGKIIHLRSAARSGYWDMGKNRRRLEEIRQEFLRGGTR